VFARTFVLVAFIALLSTAATAKAGVLGWRTLGKGDKGGDVVVLQRVLGMNGYDAGPVDGVFGRQTKRAVKRFQRRRHLTADGRVGPLTTHALSFGWPVKTASYYGPGLWGNRTACGTVLRKSTQGVAHRTFPCGARVAVYANARISIFRVIDRGPYRDGVALDLTRASARRLHVSTTQDVRFGR
jgi:peptidoglycan hydrolase-like protein with peptidoglycan-binding domain